MFKPYDSSALMSALRLYGLQYSLQYDLQQDSLKGFSETLQPLSFSGSTLINPVFSADAPILDPVSSAPDMGAMGAMAALFQSDPATIFAQALFTAMVDNGHVFEAQSNGCACCGHDHGMNAKTQIMKLSDQIQQLLDSGLDISNFNTLIGSISALGDVDADIFANSLQETAEAFAEAIFDTANEPANSDLPADTSTTGTITIGGSASGTRGSITDEDWYAVELQAGVQYTFIMLRDGDNPHEDPLLILYDSAGTEIDRNDDAEIDGDRVNRNSFITFTPDESGTYYLGASGWEVTTGDYTIYAEEGNNRPDFTLDQAAFFLTSQFYNEEKWNKTDLTYDISALSNGAKTLALMAMDAWAEVSGLTFTAAAADADPDIDFNEDNGENGGRQAFAAVTISTANNTLTSATVTISANWDTNPDGSADYALNSSRYQAYLHEVGHALGLGHSGLYNGRDVDRAGVSYHVYNQDAWNYTVMSYRDQGEAGTGTRRLVLAPQLVDIIAIQNFYGANGQTRSGDSVYGFNSTETGVLDFEGTFFNQGIPPPSLAIYDTGGTDTLDFSSYSANQVISLVEGSFSSIGDNIITDDPEDPLINNITIAVGTVIENAIGGSGDDSFIGNDSDNVFIGNGGNDTYTGGAGNDMVIMALSQSRYTISVDETNEGRFLVIAGGTEGTDRINLADVEFVGFDSGQTIVTTAALADPIEFDDDGDGNIDRRVYRNADGRWTRIEFDTDDDGTIDRITHYAFDDGGTRRVTRREIDLDDDGIINRTVHLNAEGRWERLEQDMDDDGFIDRITHYAFDDGGTRRVTRRDFDRDDDGIIDRTVHLDAEGRWQRLEQDLDDDGFIDRITHYAFDDGGTRRVTRTDFDDDDDGTIDRTVHLDANGRWERVDFDDDGDGNIDRSETYTYNANGRVSQTGFDDNANGNIDRNETYTYYANGRVSRTSFDDNNDGTTDRTETYTYNSNGNLIRTGFDDDANGTIDRNTRFTYNSDGNRIRTDFDDDADGNLDRIAFDFDGDGNIDRMVHLNADGRWTRVEQDLDDDGFIDRINHYAFDGGGTGRLTRRDFDRDDDGTIDRSESYTYDANGNRIQTDFDDNNDGTTDRSESYTYDANGNRVQTDFDVDGDGTTDRSERALSSLNGTNGFILTGIDEDDRSGLSVSSAGDVNGDGYDDLIIGAWGADPNGDRGAGETYLVYGGASAPGTEGVLDLSDLDGTNGFILTGIDAGDQSGFSVSSAGDVNGDGYDDLIIGAWLADPNGDRSGETYVVYGGASAPGTDGELNLGMLDGTNGFTLTGIDAGDRSGSSVSSAGDVNGDGYDDLIIGARDADLIGRRRIAGETYVIYGGANAPGTDGVLDLSGLDGTNGFILTGIDAGDYSGNSVSSAGDVNGDGYDDLIIGAFRANPNGDSEAGETYVVYGGASAPGTGGVLDLSGLDGTNGFILTGIDAFDGSGWSVSSAGDVNGDGYDDLIIGAFGADPNGDSTAGETYIVYGGASAPGTGGVLNLGALDGTNGFTLTGIDARDWSGSSVSSAGDINGDGYDDLIIGAHWAGPNGNFRAGETYIVYGGASAPGTGGVLDLGALDGTNGFILTGIDAHDQSGFSVSSAGDVNGDGYDDLIIGAGFADPNGDSQAGESYVIYGGATGTESLVPVTASGTAAADNFTGNAGADSFTAIATNDVVRGGAGDDMISVTALDFAAIDGGTGADTLVLDGAGLALDLTGAGHAGVDSVEVFDLSGTGANSLVLDALAVFDVTEEREGGGMASLDVLGDADDRVELNGSNFALTGTATEDGVTYNVYRDGNAQLRVETGVQVVTIPVFTSPAAVSVRENQVAAYEAAATDDEGDPLVYSLSGTDAALFTIDANTGEVSFMAAPDFEAPGDDDRDNVYDIIVTASDGTNSTDHNVAITVTNENDILVFTSPATANARENQTAAYEAAATDADGDTLVYSLSGTDAALFTINADTGEVSFITAPDFEAPGDDDRDNVYDIIVTASDGTNSTDHNVAITVTNENDILVFTSPATANARENQTAAYEAAATDADGDTLVYSLSGTDAALFTINADTGEVSFITAPDFEAPGDDDRDNVYDIIVTASDGTNSTNHNVAIRVTNENDNIPVFTSPATANAQENQTAAYMAAATDADGDALVYSLSGTDAALFAIDANTGEVSFIVAPDFEMPGDADEDNVYDITVTASDGTNRTNHNVAITVTNENNIPVFTSPAAVSVRKNQTAAYEAAATDDEGDPLVYSLSGTDAVLFTIDANTGEVSFITAPDFEMPGDADGDNVYDITVTASDGTNRTDQSVAITVTDNALVELSTLDGSNGFILNGIDANDQSGFSVSSAGDVNGDGYDDLIIGANRADPNGDRSGETYIVYGGASAPGTEGVLDLSDLDGSNGFTLTGIDAGDQSGFSVSSAGDVNGDGYDDLIIGAPYAFPNGDRRAGETYIVYGGASAPGTGGELNLEALDGTNGFTLTGIDAGDRSGSSVSSAGDVNGDGYDDLIIGARDADLIGRRRIAGETYVIYGGANAPGTDGVLDLSGLDGTNGFILNGFSPFDRSGFSVSSAGDVNGDGYDDLIIGTPWGDPDGGSNAGETYIVYGGASAPGTGGVLDLGALDGTNGFILNGIDGDDQSGRSVSSAGDVNGDGYDDLIIGADWADPNGNFRAGETYIVYGGANAPGTDGMLDLSALDGTNGFILTGIDAFDHSGNSVSSAGDVNGDGYDDLIIGARSADPNGDNEAGETYLVYGGASAPGTNSVLDLSDLDGNNGFTLTGIDRFDFSGRSVSSAGDVNGDGYDDLIIGANRADPNGNDNAGETYVIYGGATGTESLTPVTVQGMAAADNFTGNAGDDNFTAIATNDVVRGGVGDDTISVTALDFAAIDGGTGQDTLVLDGAGLSLDLTGPGNAGVDSVELFDLSGTGANSLVLDALAVFDVTEEREGGVASLDVLGDADDRVELSGSSFALTGTATEDGVTYNVYRDGNAQLRIETGVQVVTIPVFTSPAAVSVRENQTAAYEAATDADGDALVYSLSGTDAALFTINANTGEVSFIAAPDFEMPGDADGDNVYDITVTASDGTNSTNHNVAITVTNENDNIPVFTSPAAVSAQENQTAAYEAAATDADGDTLVYSLSGTDAALFTIDRDTGEVRFRVAPDFEMPGDADGDNVYDITVTASDGTNRTDHNVAITVTDDNIPVFTSPFVAGARENQTAAYEAAAMDDEGDPLVYSLSGTDAALFTIDATTGEVSFIAAPDFEVPGDADGDNVYDITVTASDGDNNTDRDVAIIVTNENDNIPVFTSPAAASVAEGQSAVYRATATDGDGDMPRYSLSGTDAALFRIGSTTGEVRFRVAPDFEMPGDADGDNVYDITVTASDGTNRTDHNVAITVTDGYDPVNLSSLDGSNGFTLNGINRGDESGFSVSSAGDVNGDGYDDLIIGASGVGSVQGEYGTIFGPGETYIVYGGANAPGTDGVLDLSSLDGTNGFTLTGINRGDESGHSVSSAGDINGDGYDDLIIGAPGVGGVQDEFALIRGPGEAYVVYGGATGADLVLDRSTLDGTNGFTLTGIDAYDQSGYSVSSAGDVNGDGYDDLIIGAPVADETYIVYGGASAPGTGGVLDLSALDGINGFILNGIDSNDNSGVSVSSAGDVNGDGYDDLIIGAPEADPNGNRSGGETYVVYGGASAPGTGGVLDLSDLDGTNGFILTGIDGTDRSGFSVSSAGDVNGDGYDDLIIGALGADPNGNRSGGETYVIYGGASAPGTGGRFNLSTLNGINGFILNGIDADDRSGISVSSAGDVNGDGYDDLIIGARFASPNGDRSGETYVIYGGANAPGTGGVLNLSDLDGTNGFIIAGIDARDRSGRSVSSAGDVNGDGYDDLIIGAQDADPNGNFQAGETYIVYGGATGTESLVPVTALGTAAADNFTGNAGDDSFTAIATNDVVRGGAGNDTIRITALDFAAIDGGTGQDALVLDGAGLSLDLTGAGHAGVDSVEVFDLSGTGANSLVLDALAVFDVTEERAGGAASLDVLGDADDRVDLSGSNFALTGTATEDGVTYNVYRDGNAQLRIETGVMVTLAATGSQSARFKTDTKTDTGIDPVADPRTDTRTDPGTDPESGTRLDEALMNSDPLMNNDLWNNDLWNGLWVDGVKSLDQPVHIDEDAILIPLSDPLSFGPLASGPLPGPWGDLMCWPGLESHPAMQNDLAMILPEMEIVTAYMEGF